MAYPPNTSRWIALLFCFLKLAAYFGGSRISEGILGLVDRFPTRDTVATASVLSGLAHIGLMQILVYLLSETSGRTTPRSNRSCMPR
jgi:hypothetical protein